MKKDKCVLSSMVFDESNVDYNLMQIKNGSFVEL